MNLIFISLCIVLIIVYFLRISRDLILEYIHVNKNKSYLDLSKYFCEMSYDMIYKDKLLAYSSNGHKVSGDELESIQRDFIKLTIDLMGDTNLNYLIKFYGGLVNLNENMILWFRSKNDNDEIFEYANREKEHTEQTDLNHLYDGDT